MRGSHTKVTPPSFAEWLERRNSDWQPSYPFPTDIREFVISALLLAQRGLCVYCGRKLLLARAGSSFHVEHFRPRNAYPSLETDLDNLYLSCGQETDTGRRSQTCGTTKDNWFDENGTIEPAYPECTNRFWFSLTGTILPNTDQDVAAHTMITKLNLNHPELVRDRKEILFILDELGEQGLDAGEFFDFKRGIAESYAHMVYQRFGETIP